MKPTKSFFSPNIFRKFPELIAVESTRLGGVSLEPYSSLNLGKNTADSEAHVQENRNLLSEQLGFNWAMVAYGKQVHGAEVLCVEQSGYSEGYDAFITKTKGVALSVTVADCTPIMLFDPVHKACGVAHAGWRGAAARIGTRTLEAMAEQFGTRAQDCHVYIGTCIGYDRFEVGPEVVAEFGAEFSRRANQTDKYFLDLKAAISAEMQTAGVPATQIEISTKCTWENNDLYYSHRKERGLTGRFCVLMGIF
jgi:polyphenol oxidase